MPGLSPTRYLIFFSFLLSFFFFPFSVLLFSINIYLNKCYLKKCNKQQEAYRVSREKIVHRILNILIKKTEKFYHFAQFSVGKPELMDQFRFRGNCPGQNDGLKEG